MWFILMITNLLISFNLKSLFQAELQITTIDLLLFFMKLRDFENKWNNHYYSLFFGFSQKYKVSSGQKWRAYLSLPGREEAELRLEG